MDFKRLPHFEARHSKTLSFNERELFDTINDLPMDEYLEVTFETEKQAESARSLLYNVYNADKELAKMRGYGVAVYTVIKKPKSLMIARKPTYALGRRVKVDGEGEVIDRATGKIVDWKKGKK